jgi:hypothetical protein
MAPKLRSFIDFLGGRLGDQPAAAAQRTPSVQGHAAPG